MKTAMYLRKSRAEEVNNTVYETVLKHKDLLLEYAKNNNLVISEIYEEVVSGEKLYERPQMLKLLSDVEKGLYEAVLCMDIDRLGRGTMSEQGIILETFKKTGTKIITPRKEYNLLNELDEEYTEFESFIARRELKLIKRRLRRGLEQTVKNGAFVSCAPYGYTKTLKNKTPTLLIKEEEAEFVKKIFDMYINGLGCQKIAYTLNALGAKSRKTEFSRTSIRKILTNPVYIGKILWNKTKHEKSHGKIITSTRDKNDWIYTDGIHEKIIDKETFCLAQDIMKNRSVPSLTLSKETVSNPFAGLIICKNCGRKMQMKNLKKKGTYLLCTTKGCSRATKIEYIQEKIFSLFKDYPPVTFSEPKEEPVFNRAKLNSEILKLSRQKEKIYDLLEDGTYSKEIFSLRKTELEKRITTLQKLTLTQDKSSFDATLFINIYKLLSLSENEEKNLILKSLIEKIVYYKPKTYQTDEFDLEITLKTKGLQGE